MRTNKQPLELGREVAGTVGDVEVADDEDAEGVCGRVRARGSRFARSSDPIKRTGPWRVE